jgi:hypothetical protein
MAAPRRWRYRAKATEIDMPITDLREIPFHGLWKTAVAARIAYGRIRDYLSV